MAQIVNQVQFSFCVDVSWYKNIFVFQPKLGGLGAVTNVHFWKIRGSLRRHMTLLIRVFYTYFIVNTSTFIMHTQQNTFSFISKRILEQKAAKKSENRTKFHEINSKQRFFWTLFTKYWVSWNQYLFQCTVAFLKITAHTL